MTWRKHAASPGPLGVQGTIRLRLAGASTRAAMSSAFASSASIERRRRLLARVVVVEGRVLVLGEEPARRVGRVSEQIAHRRVDLGAAQAARDAGRDRVGARRATPGAAADRAGSVLTDLAVARRRRRGDDRNCRQSRERDSVCRSVKHGTSVPSALGAGTRIRPADGIRCERVGRVGVAPPNCRATRIGDFVRSCPRDGDSLVTACVRGRRGAVVRPRPLGDGSRRSSVRRKAHLGRGRVDRGGASGLQGDRQRQTASRR